jgi:hypothetical protein
LVIAMIIPITVKITIPYIIHVQLWGTLRTPYDVAGARPGRRS